MVMTPFTIFHGKTLFDSQLGYPVEGLDCTHLVPLSTNCVLLNKISSLQPTNYSFLQQTLEVEAKKNCWKPYYWLLVIAFLVGMSCSYRVSLTQRL